MNYKHGYARVGQVERLHKIWRKVLDRCSNAAILRKPTYAGRGITVCEEWRDYMTFRSWAMQNGYADHLTIERVDNDGHYEPSNCKWVSHAEQTRNRSTTKRLTLGARTQTQAEWARELGLSDGTIAYRLKQGWPIERALARHP